jgi:hypothetical protein
MLKQAAATKSLGSFSKSKYGGGVFTFDTQVYPWHCPIPVVYVEGSSAEMGRQFGRATREIIQKIVSFNVLTLEKLLKQCKISKRDHLSTTESVVSKFTESEYLDELNSMAEAAGVSYEDLLLTNTNIDLIYELPHPESHGPLFCSFFSAWGKAVSDGISLVAGHNDDGGRHMDQFLVLKIANPEHGFPFVNPVVPGYLGYHSMINSSQTYACATGLDDVMRNSQVQMDGVPGWILFRWLGQYSESTDDAVRRFLSVPNTTCINWCFSSSREGTKIVEATPKHHAFARFPNKTRDWMISAGKTLCPSLYPYLKKVAHPSTGDYRYQSVKRAVEQRYGMINAEAGVEIMSDHYDSSRDEIGASEHTICRHMEYAGRFAGTCRSLVVQFNNSKNSDEEENECATEISVSLGNGCYGFWRNIKFDKKLHPISEYKDEVEPTPLYLTKTLAA